MIEILNLILPIVLLIILVIYFELDKKTAKIKKTVSDSKHDEIVARLKSLEKGSARQIDGLERIFSDVEKLYEEVDKLKAKL